MNPQFFANLFKAIGNFFAKNGKPIATVGGAAIASSVITAAAVHYAHKKIESKHRKEDAEKYKAEFDRRLEALENKYKNNEAELKRKVNDLCREFSIAPLF